MTDKDLEQAQREKKQQIYLAQKRKEKMIAETMSKKESSIKLAGIQRDAVLIYTTLFNKYEDKLESKHIEKAIEQIIEIKEWLKNTYEIDKKLTFLEIKELLKEEAQRKAEETKEANDDELPF